MEADVDRRHPADADETFEIPLASERGSDPALALLRNLPRHASKVVEKILRSAVANAEQKEMGDSESMVVSKAFVDCGPTLKRFRSRSQGRANAIQKRMSHITVVVSTASEKEKK